jgi:mannosyltransferase
MHRLSSVSWVTACTLLALALRLLRIGHQSLHIDEIISFDSAAWTSGSAFWKGLLHDIHGPLTSALLHGWLRLGQSEAWLRLLYAVPSVLTIPLFYYLTRDLLGRTTARVAALAIAISPFQVWYGQEVRNYAWLLLFVTGALIAFFRIWDGRAGRAAWLSLVVLLALSLLTNYSALLLVISLTVLVLGRRDGRLALRWGATLCVLAAAFSPWFLDWYHRIGGERLFLDRPRTFGVPLRQASGFSVVNIPYMFWVFSFGYSLGPSVTDLHLDRSFSAIIRHWPVLVAGGLSVGTAAVLGAREVHKRGRTALLACLLLIPLALVIVLTLRDVKAFNPRYAMVAYPPFLMLVAAGWQWQKRLGRAAAMVALALTLFSLANHYFDPRYAKEDMRSAARTVLDEERPGDTIVVIDNNQPFRHYFSHRGGGVAPVFHRHKRFLQTEDELRAHVRSAMRPEGRTWLVLSRWWEVASREKIYEVFDSLLTRTDHWEFPGVELSLYEPPQHELRPDPARGHAARDD